MKKTIHQEVNPFDDFKVGFVSRDAIRFQIPIQEYFVRVCHKTLPYELKLGRMKDLTKEERVTPEEAALLVAEAYNELMKIYLFGEAAYFMTNPESCKIFCAIQWDHNKKDWFTLDKDKQPIYGKEQTAGNFSTLREVQF